MNQDIPTVAPSSSAVNAPAGTCDLDARNRALLGVQRLIQQAARRRASYAKADPDDLAQDSFLRFLRCWPTNDPARGNVQQFALYCTLASAIRVRQLIATRAAARTVPVDEDLDAAPEARCPDPAKLAELHDELARLEAALDTIPARYVELLRERYADGDDYPTIAERHGLSDPAWVRDRVQKCLAALRRKLGVPAPGRVRLRYSRPKETRRRAEARRAGRAEAERLHREGVPIPEIAGRVGLSESWLYDLLGRRVRDRSRKAVGAV